MWEAIRLFKPPEWDVWTVGDRAAYTVSLVLALGLAALGASKLYEITHDFIMRVLG